MPVTNEELVNAILQPIRKAFEEDGITVEYLVKKLKAELNATEPKPWRKRAVKAWNVRQRARMDAHKLMGHYPAEKKEITGGDGKPVEFIVTVEDEE
jgi:hypothetical protein